MYKVSKKALLNVYRNQYLTNAVHMSLIKSNKKEPTPETKLNGIVKHFSAKLAAVYTKHSYIANLASFQFVFC